MVNANTMDLGRGFLKLEEDNNSRRSSSLFRQKPLEFNENGLHYVTRINCGCGQCVPFRVKVERDDGGLRIGKLTLASNCHLIIIIFGFFFLVAGSVLTALAYKEPTPLDDPDLPLHARASAEHVDSPSRQEGKVAGPIFIIVGSVLFFVGFTLTALACKLNREAKRQLQLNRFTWETPPLQTPDIFNTSSEHFATFANMDTFSVRSRELSSSSGGGGPHGNNRRDSSFTFSRQLQHPPPPLTTIAQAVPVGIFLFGDSTTSPKSPSIKITDTSGFQDIELGSPTTESAPTSAAVSGRRFPDPRRKKERAHSDGASLDDCGATCNAERSKNNLNPNESTQGKVNLALRPSLPIIPMFASPHYFSRVVTPLDARNLYVSSRSDEPFGSIASLSTSGDIACFPVTSSSTNNSHGANNNCGLQMQPTPECDEVSSTTSTSSVIPSAANVNPNSNPSTAAPGRGSSPASDLRSNSHANSSVTTQHPRNDANANNPKNEGSRHSAKEDVISTASTNIPNKNFGIRSRSVWS
ncbi:unnamed protein product [Orchesella dallaii]|uniref:Uncharacterized protein n=1 Tax=Orchesella dallaii TaxID=48710 RepID=A0ABP1Q842_9HEXA